MNIRIVAVGKLKEKYLRDAAAEYMKRLTPFAKAEIVELQDEPLNDESPAYNVMAREKEGLKILRALKPSSFVIGLDIGGKPLSSEDLAAFMEDLALKGRSDISFIIGGPSGLSPEVVKRCDFRLSLSAMTFTHQLARVLLIEQLYRSFKIRRGEPYHL